MKKERLTFKARVAHRVDDEITLGGLDITQHVTAFQVKTGVRETTSVILKLIDVPLDLELDADVEMAEVQPKGTA